jgi:hypothetical protein
MPSATADAPAKASIADAAEPAKSPPPPVALELLRAEPSFDAKPGTLGPPPLPNPSLGRLVLDPARLDRPVLEGASLDRPADAAKPASRRRTLRFGALALAFAALALVVAAVVARNGILTVWPSTTAFYRSVRLADPVGAGLEVKLTPARTLDSLVVDGRITNTGATRRELPRLRVALRDGNNAEVAFKLIDPPRNSLAPGATTAFSTVFKHPDSAATGVAVTFASQ